MGEYFALCEFTEGNYSDRPLVIDLGAFTCLDNVAAWTEELSSKVGRISCDLVFMIFRGASPISYARGVIHSDLSITVE